MHAYLTILWTRHTPWFFFGDVDSLVRCAARLSECQLRSTFASISDFCLNVPLFSNEGRIYFIKLSTKAQKLNSVCNFVQHAQHNKIRVVISTFNSQTLVLLVQFELWNEPS